MVGGSQLYLDEMTFPGNNVCEFGRAQLAWRSALASDAPS
jgi:hypothetical protein